MLPGALVCLTPSFFPVVTDTTLQANDCNKVMLCLSELQGINFSAFQPKDTAGFPNTCI